ncbi:MAG: FAD-dependent oxidoreductase [Thermofilaceae archaeon]
MSKIAVLGGGWAGITLALELKRAHPLADVIVLEREREPGGLLRSVTLEGHVVDAGGSHVIFSRNEEVLKRMLELLSSNYTPHSRKSFVRMGHHFIPYPIENGLYVLPPEERAEALVSFLEALLSLEEGWRPGNLREWIRGFFGRWIAERYLEPYNRKVWKRPLEVIDIDWVYTPGRLPIPDWRDVVRAASGVPTIGYREQAIFYYPLKGGIEALFEAAYRRALELGVKVATGTPVRSLRKVGGSFVVNERFRVEKVYSTIPLRELVRAAEAPESIIKAAEDLDYNRVLVVGVALKGLAPNQHWVYVPDEDVLFHRYAWISNYSPYNAPQGESTLIAEVTLPPHASTKGDIVERVIEQLADLEIIDEPQILRVDAWLHEYGYPVHTLSRQKALREIREWLNNAEIESVGRWGSWEYWNMDRVYAEVLKLVQGS